MVGKQMTPLFLWSNFSCSFSLAHLHSQQRPKIYPDDDGVYTELLANTRKFGTNTTEIMASLTVVYLLGKDL